MKDTNNILTMYNYLENNMNRTWFIEEPIDEEHKYWKLLAYFQRMDINIKNGYMISELFSFSRLYQDMREFVENNKLKNQDEQTKTIFENIYKKANTEIKNEIESIAVSSFVHMSDKYKEIKKMLSLYNDNINIVRQNFPDKRKNTTYYIEKCNCGILEKYILHKNNKLVYDSDLPKQDLQLTNEINYILIESNLAFNSFNIIEYTKMMSLIN
jgi:hypothetical protein